MRGRIGAGSPLALGTRVAQQLLQEPPEGAAATDRVEHLEGAVSFGVLAVVELAKRLLAGRAGDVPRSIAFIPRTPRIPYVLGSNDSEHGRRFDDRVPSLGERERRGGLRRPPGLSAIDGGPHCWRDNVVESDKGSVSFDREISGRSGPTSIETPEDVGREASCREQSGLHGDGGEPIE